MPTIPNTLLSRLPERDLRRVERACEPMQLRFGQTLSEPGDLLQHVYFPQGSFVSSLCGERGARGVEMGMAGTEGMVGAHVALGVLEAPLLDVVQGSGPAARMEASAFVRELARSAPLRLTLNRYLYVLVRQMAITANCLRSHEAAPRLARWLLMTQDRAHADTFRMTQEFLSHMIGVRRAGVTVAAVSLQGRGLITYRRGVVTVLDRRGLQRAACSCYARQTAAYRAVLGPVEGTVLRVDMTS